MRLEHRFDLARFDAEAADLDLVVDPAEELDGAVGRPAGPVAGAVQAGAGRAVGVGDEPRGGQARLAEVAAGQAGAAEVELAGRPGQAEPQGAVEDVGGHLRVGVADRHRAPVPGRALPQRGVHGRLGRAVGVEHPPAGGEAGHHLGRDGLRAAQQRRAQREVGVGGQRREDRRRQGEVGHPLLGEVVGELGAGDAPLGGDDDEAGAATRRPGRAPRTPGRSSVRRTAAPGSRPVMRSRSVWVAISLATPAWGTTTPLGRPVDPDV